ncbi:MAG: anti-sigma factor [Trebonia sp.]|jgi:anti-sigma-K factor RskA
MSVQSHELHLLTGAYAVDALTGDELAEFEKHLQRCASCTEEVRGLQETAARLGMTTAIEPPSWMRQQVLAAAGRTRQLPPSGGRLLDRRTARRATRLGRSLPRSVAAVTMAAAIVVLAVLQVNTRDQLQQTQQGNREVAAILAAPGARIETSSTTLGGSMTAVISPRDREAVITTADMPAPADARVYQLWVISASGARSAGLLPGSNSGGVTSPVLASGVQSGDRLGITVEPAGGTKQPTTTPIVLLAANT